MTVHRLPESWLESRVDRRSFLIGSLIVAGIPYASRLHALRAPRWRVSPFTLGIGSGDPTADGVVLWTRLAVEPLAANGGMPHESIDVAWQVATDEGLKNVVKQGRALAAAESAHSVHVEVDGLSPDRWYWYRFTSGDAASPIGRTRTFPAANSPTDRLRFAFASCQHYENGYFTAYRHLAAEDLDMVFHLGDYIYEGPGRDGQTRKHAGLELKTLDDYRTRYAQYRLDPDLQAAHARFPWIVTPDDHEVENDYANDISQHDDPRDVFLQRRAGAYQAYYEHMPLRRRSIPVGPAIQLYRPFTYGSLASFFVLDTRQYRTDQPCGGGTKAACPEVADPSATLLGAAQEKWLFGALGASRGGWNILPQQVMMAKVDEAAGPDERYSMDRWSAYDAGRTRLLAFLGSRKPANPIVLSGDIHSSWVNDLKVDFRNALSPTVATELAGTSITSGGDGADLPARMNAILAENPFVKFYNGQRGYVTCELTRRQLKATYQIVEYITRPDAPKVTRASFLVESGRPGAQRI